MKYISIVVFVIVGFVSILLLTNEPIIDPFSEGIDFSSQELVSMDYDTELIASFQSNLSYYNSHFHVINQTIFIEDQVTNAYLEIALNNINDVRFERLSFDSLILETKGIENFIDTQGITGTIQATLNTYKNTTNTYVESAIGLKNPPFNLSIDEKQFMPNQEAQGQALTLIDLSTLTIDPIDAFNSLVLNRNNTSIYEMNYGHKLIITYDNILFTGTKARFEVIIYQNYLVMMTLEITGTEVTIPANTIAFITEDVTVSLNINYHFDMLVDVTDEIPYNSEDLESFRRVDTFSLPDVTSFFNNFTN